MDLPEELRRQIVSMLPTTSSDKSGISSEKKLCEKDKMDLKGQPGAWCKPGGGIYQTIIDCRETAVQIQKKPSQLDENLPPHDVNEMEKFEWENKALEMEIATAGFFSLDETGLICLVENLKGYSEGKIISNAGDENIIDYLEKNPAPNVASSQPTSTRKTRMPLTYATMNLQDNLSPMDILREQSQFVPPDTIINKEGHRKSGPGRNSSKGRTSFELFPNTPEGTQNRGSQSHSTNGCHGYSEWPGSSRQGWKGHGVRSPGREDCNNKDFSKSTKSLFGPATAESTQHKEERISVRRDTPMKMKEVAKKTETATMKRPNWAQKFFDDIQKAIDSGNKDFVRGDFHPCQRKGKRAISRSSRNANSRNDGGDRSAAQPPAPISNENLTFSDDAAQSLRCSEEATINSGLNEMSVPSETQESVRSGSNMNGIGCEVDTSNSTSTPRNESSDLPLTVAENSEMYEFGKLSEVGREHGPRDENSVSERPVDQKFAVMEYSVMEDPALSSKYEMSASSASDKFFDGNILRIIMGEKVEEPKPTGSVDRSEPSVEEQQPPTQMLEQPVTAEGESTEKNEGRLENITEAADKVSRETVGTEVLVEICTQEINVLDGAESRVSGDTSTGEAKTVGSTSEGVPTADITFVDMKPNTNMQTDSTVSICYSNATSAVPEMENFGKVSTEIEDCDSCEKGTPENSSSSTEITDESTELIAFATEFVAAIVKEAEQQISAQFSVNETVEVAAGTKECVQGSQVLSPVTDAAAQENVAELKGNSSEVSEQNLEVREPLTPTSAITDLTNVVADKVGSGFDQVETPNQCLSGEDVVASSEAADVCSQAKCPTKPVDVSDDVNVDVNAELEKLVLDLHDSIVHTENVTSTVPTSEGLEKTEEIVFFDKAESKTDVTMETESQVVETNAAVDMEQLGDPVAMKDAEVSINTDEAKTDELVGVDAGSNVAEFPQVNDQVDNAAASSKSEIVEETKSSYGASEKQNSGQSAKPESQLQEEEDAQKCNTVTEITVPVGDKIDRSTTEKHVGPCAHQ